MGVTSFVIQREFNFVNRSFRSQKIQWQIDFAVDVFSFMWREKCEEYLFVAERMTVSEEWV